MTGPELILLYLCGVMALIGALMLLDTSGWLDRFEDWVERVFGAPKGKRRP